MAEQNRNSFKTTYALDQQIFAVAITTDDDNILIEMENMAAKYKFGKKISCTEIVDITKDQIEMELTTAQFFSVLVRAFSNDPNITLEITLEITAINKSLLLKINWLIYGFITKTMTVELNDLNISDVERMSRMMVDLCKTKEELQELKSKTSNIVNVTMFTDKVKRKIDVGKPVIQLTVNKRFAQSMLYITAILPVKTESDVESCNKWTCVDNATNQKTVEYALTESITNTENEITTAIRFTNSCLIEGHNVTGVQTLTLEYEPDDVPSVIINPVSDGKQEYSLIRVEEIL